MKRYEKFVLQAEKGITFEDSEGTSDELINRELNIDTANVYSKNYVNPVIPEGYKHIDGKWNNGFVIERCSDGSQFVWIPVGSLRSNGILDGDSDTEEFERFGKRDFGVINYSKNEFSEEVFHELFTDELALQFESVKKYGGFYISRYNISKNKETGEPQSVKGEMPWTRIDFYDAYKLASSIEDNEAVKSHLTFGAEYDSVLEWILESGAKAHRQIAEDSSEWGNYTNSWNRAYRMTETGSREVWCANNIYDLAGNVQEWTQEEFESSYRVIRGGSFINGGDVNVARRMYHKPNDIYLTGEIGFRAALYIK